MVEGGHSLRRLIWELGEASFQPHTLSSHERSGRRRTWAQNAPWRPQGLPGGSPQPALRGPPHDLLRLGLQDQLFVRRRCPWRGALNPFAGPALAYGNVRHQRYRKPSCNAGKLFKRYQEFNNYREMDFPLWKVCFKLSFIAMKMFHKFTIYPITTASFYETQRSREFPTTISWIERILFLSRNWASSSEVPGSSFFDSDSGSETL